jgi:hypothetical protein
MQDTLPIQISGVRRTPVVQGMLLGAVVNQGHVYHAFAAASEAG